MRSTKRFAALGENQMFASTTNPMSYTYTQYRIVVIKQSTFLSVFKAQSSKYFLAILQHPCTRFRRSRLPPSAPADFRPPCICRHEKWNHVHYRCVISLVYISFKCCCFDYSRIGFSVFTADTSTMQRYPLGHVTDEHLAKIHTTLYNKESYITVFTKVK
jgi:hypothetical protein